MANPSWFKGLSDPDRYADTLCLWYLNSKEGDSNRDAYVYLLKCGVYHKIGRAKDVQKRIGNLATATPYKIALIESVYVDDAILLESILHSACKHFRKRGEWFNLPDEMLTVVKKVLNSDLNHG